VGQRCALDSTVTGLDSGQPYVLCGWLKGEAIGGHGNAGANVSVMGGFISSASLTGTFDWTQTCAIFNAPGTDY
jgi:hypothetical protein